MFKYSLNVGEKLWEGVGLRAGRRPRDKVYWELLWSVMCISILLKHLAVHRDGSIWVEGEVNGGGDLELDLDTVGMSIGKEDLT